MPLVAYSEVHSASMTLSLLSTMLCLLHLIYYYCIILQSQGIAWHVCCMAMLSAAQSACDEEYTYKIVDRKLIYVILFLHWPFGGSISSSMVAVRSRWMTLFRMT